MSPNQQPNPSLMRDLHNFAAGAESFAKTEFSLEPREEMHGQVCDVTVVFRPNGDVIYQLFPKAKKKLLNTEAARSLIAEMLDVYFGSLDGFSAEFTSIRLPNLEPFESWAIKSARMSHRPAFSKEYHVYGFAQYVNQALADCKE